MGPLSQPAHEQGMATIRPLPGAAHAAVPAAIESSEDREVHSGVQGLAGAGDDTSTREALTVGSVFSRQGSGSYGERGDGRVPASDVSSSWNPVPAEVLQSCSTAIRRMGDAKVASIAVTSTSPGEGRTTLAAGMAITIARELGRPVVLLDLDVERRGVERLANLRDAPGIMQLLGGTAPKVECIQAVDHNVDVIVSGGTSLTELATKLDALESVVLDLIGEGRVVVADLPPLTAGAATARIADLFHSVALVVRAGAVPVPLIQSATAVLGQQPVAIMNRVPGSRRSLIRKLRRRK